MGNETVIIENLKKAKQIVRENQELLSWLGKPVPEEPSEKTPPYCFEEKPDLLWEFDKEHFLKYESRIPKKKSGVSGRSFLIGLGIASIIGLIEVVAGYFVLGSMSFTVALIIFAITIAVFLLNSKKWCAEEETKEEAKEREKKTRMIYKEYENDFQRQRDEIYRENLRKRKADRNEVLEMQSNARSLLEKEVFPICKIPEFMLKEEDFDRLIDLFESGRADTLDEAIEVYKREQSLKSLVKLKEELDDDRRNSERNEAAYRSAMAALKSLEAKREQRDAKAEYESEKKRTEEFFDKF